MLIPEENQKDLAEIPENVLQKITVHPVKTLEEVLVLALTQNPVEKTPAHEDTSTKTSQKNENNDLHAN